MNVCEKRCYNNFFSSLFHDLPEILTKDIISPVKSSVEGLEDIIKEFEKKQVENTGYRLTLEYSLFPKPGIISLAGVLLGK